MRRLNKAKFLFLVIPALLSPAAAAADDEVVRTFPEIREMNVSEARKGRAVSLRGVVTFVRYDGFVLATTYDRDQNAVFVVRTPETEGPTEVSAGDAFRVEGRTCVWENIAAVEAHSLVRIGRGALAYPEEPKWYDVRKGWRNLRRGRLEGRIAAVDYVRRHSDGHIETIITLKNWQGKIGVHVAGRMRPSIAQVGNAVEVTGIVRNIFDESGHVLASLFEVSSPEGVSVLATSRERLVESLLLSLGALAIFAAAGFCAAWMRSVRKRKEAELLAADRKRIAADLHDTLEQHLAGARILLDGAASVKDMPQAAQKRIRLACEVLRNAKTEVRDAVTGLKSDIENYSMMADAIERIAADVTRLGRTKAIADCKGLRECAGNMRGNAHVNLLLIIREAVTNAIKHGKADNIRIFADGSTVRISNDGEPFDAETAMGPETGHYGLSGMRERCSRNGWSLFFGRDGAWSFVEVKRESCK